MGGRGEHTPKASVLFAYGPPPLDPLDPPTDPAPLSPVVSDAVPVTRSRTLVSDLGPALASLPPPDAVRASRRALAALEAGEGRRVPGQRADDTCRYTRQSIRFLAG